MKWLLFSAHKATQRFLTSQRYHLHGGSRHRLLHASYPIGWPKLPKMKSFSLYYSTSTILNHTESSLIRSPNGNIKIEIISRETIKPSSPTPHHLRTFNLSIIDQFMSDVYTPFILFLPNTNQATFTDVINQRSKHLKESLSEVLTRFYPVAGKVKDNLQIDCNDEGICYTEARVDQTLVEFLAYPDDERVRVLSPRSPCTAETSVGNHVISIQVNIFKCGGIGLSSSMSHKIFDGHTYFIFIKAWAAAARGSPETVLPSFVASEIFPNNPSLVYSVLNKLIATKSLCTKRFVFNSTALALLKAQPVASVNSAHPPTRTEATTAIIWKAAAEAASKVRPFGSQSPHALMSAVNLRKRASPPLPEASLGNLIDGAGAMCFPGRGELDLSTLMGEVRDSIARINSDHIESMKGEKGHETFNEILRRVNHLADMTVEGDLMLASSVLNSRIYDLDFGWGKPIWFYIMNAGLARFVVLNDTLKGGGVEAIVTLSPEEMEIFERDSEVLSYATVNPSPLQFVQ